MKAETPRLRGQTREEEKAQVSRFRPAPHLFLRLLPRRLRVSAFNPLFRSVRQRREIPLPQIFRAAALFALSLAAGCKPDAGPSAGRVNPPARPNAPTPAPATTRSAEAEWPGSVAHTSRDGWVTLRTPADWEEQPPRDAVIMYVGPAGAEGASPRACGSPSRRCRSPLHRPNWPTPPSTTSTSSGTSSSCRGTPTRRSPACPRPGWCTTAASPASPTCSSGGTRWSGTAGPSTSSPASPNVRDAEAARGTFERIEASVRIKWPEPDAGETPATSPCACPAAGDAPRHADRMPCRHLAASVLIGVVSVTRRPTPQPAPSDSR